jgi:hypothetical protein
METAMSLGVLSQHVRAAGGGLTRLKIYLALLAVVLLLRFADSLIH